MKPWQALHLPASEYGKAHDTASLVKRIAQLERQVSALSKTVDEMREKQAAKGFWT